MDISIDRFKISTVNILEGIEDIDFGEVMIQITKQLSGEYIVTNAVNGYGNNCFEEYKNCKVIIDENNRNNIK